MSNLRVHLDHLIRRQSIRYLTAPDVKSTGVTTNLGSEDRSLRYDDLLRADGWVTQIRKPDFQRETNAWTPKDCVEFLDTVVYGKVIPSIILWLNKETGLTYVLDGAHRLSVLRAWMLDDWGDKAGDYYQRRDQEQIKQAACETRTLVEEQMGLFSDFKAAHAEFNQIINEGGAPRTTMPEQRFHQATFFNGVVSGLLTLAVQWEKGDYESAERSFLKINRSGQALDPWEATLIEYRNSSYARCVMSIANGGECGHYWPASAKDAVPSLVNTLVSFDKSATRIYKMLFVPPFRRPITDLNVPFMVAPEYFQKHKYLLEVIPVITEQIIAIKDDKQIELMKRDSDSPASIVIANAEKMLRLLGDNLDHLFCDSANSKSLQIVPLFYWYNYNGKFIRALFYGFLYWLLSGNEGEIKHRKITFSINRERFESVLFDFKSEIASSLQLKAGAGLKAAGKVAGFIQELLVLLHANIGKTTEDLTNEIVEIIQSKGLLSSSKSKVKKSRAYSEQDKTTINIREMFSNAIRCHICGGVVNLQQSLQYDHTQDFAVYRITDPKTGKPTHPFCNNWSNKKAIEEGKKGEKQYSVPLIEINSSTDKQQNGNQLDFWGDSEFPE